MFVEPIKLPHHAFGYDAFNVLVLNQPNLAAMSADQRISTGRDGVDWVLQPGKSGQPAAGSLPAPEPAAGESPFPTGESVRAAQAAPGRVPPPTGEPEPV